MAHTHDLIEKWAKHTRRYLRWVVEQICKLCYIIITGRVFMIKKNMYCALLLVMFFSCTISGASEISVGWWLGVCDLQTNSYVENAEVFIDEMYMGKTPTRHSGDDGPLELFIDVCELSAGEHNVYARQFDHMEIVKPTPSFYNPDAVDNFYKVNSLWPGQQTTFPDAGGPDNHLSVNLMPYTLISWCQGYGCVWSNPFPPECETCEHNSRVIGDFDCNCIVTDLELSQYTDLWKQGIVCGPLLLEAIDNWAKVYGPQGEELKVRKLNELMSYQQTPISSVAF
ncbi:MAG: hypothetical protein D4Q77_02735 [Methanothrix sp.]|nr:MAG: hypothetical protein D4Q77_02735 [Methanothrix sp.]